jgi:hypothetical protein
MIHFWVVDEWGHAVGGGWQGYADALLERISTHAGKDNGLPELVRLSEDPLIAMYILSKLGRSLWMVRCVLEREFMNRLGAKFISYGHPPRRVSMNPELRVLYLARLGTHPLYKALGLQKCTGYV